MKTIKTLKATDADVEPVIIEISVAPKEYTSLKDWEVELNQYADELADAMLDSMPQGLIDRLMARLMMKKASLFVVKIGK